jgi:hypothetical protein
LCDAGGSGHPAGTADILYDHLLPEDLADALRHDASEHIGRTSSREWDDHR